jgi:hypothetical protein
VRLAVIDAEVVCDERTCEEAAANRPEVVLPWAQEHDCRWDSTGSTCGARGALRCASVGRERARDLMGGAHFR